MHHAEVHNICDICLKKIIVYLFGILMFHGIKCNKMNINFGMQRDKCIVQVDFCACQLFLKKLSSFKKKKKMK